MKLLSKKRVLLFMIVLLIVNCGTIDNESEPDAFTAKAQIYVDRILAENSTKEYSVGILTTGVDGGMSGTRPTGYVLKINVESMLVLTNSIDSLRIYGIYRKNLSDYYGAGGGMADLPLMGIRALCDTLDSIEIVTDSVIVMPALSVSSTNLTHLPAEIGKIRVGGLDISDNQIKDLPLEIMSIFDYLSDDSGKIKTMENPFSQSYWDSLPDTLQQWLTKHTYY